MYDKNSNLSFLTLIREKLKDSQESERLPLTLAQLWGTGAGKATTIYPDGRSPDEVQTRLTLVQLDDRYLEQQLQFGEKTLKSRGKIEGSGIIFEQGEIPIQVCLLPDGASSNCPLLIKPRQGFVLESGWLLSPTQRQRLIRRYNGQGSWVSLTLVKEAKIS